MDGELITVQTFKSVMLSGMLFSEEEIRSQLGRIFEGLDFRNSKRSQQFLRYVVDCALRGDGSALKETTLGSALFGRPPGYDASSDPSVRVRANDVRKRLTAYYNGAGAADAVRIELAAGSYLPKFTLAPALRADGDWRGPVGQLRAALAEAQLATSRLEDYAGGDAVVVLRAGRVVDCDAGALAFFQCGRDELLGRSVSELSPIDSTVEVRVTLRVMGEAWSPNLPKGSGGDRSAR